MKKHFVIPTNFMETGYVFNGMIAIRNAVEGVILGILGFFLCKIIPMPDSEIAISYHIMIIFPLFMLGAVGVQGDPLSVFIFDFFKWRKRRKPYFYSNHGEAYTQEAADMLLEAPQLRDFIADAIDKTKAKFAAEEIDYVEGKTFRFAEDPEQEALRMAQEDLQTKRNQELAEAMAAKQIPITEQPDAPKPKPVLRSSLAASINAQQISDNLVLTKLPEEEGADHG